MNTSSTYMRRFTCEKKIKKIWKNIKENEIWTDIMAEQTKKLIKKLIIHIN